jgi:Fe-S-cluster-containing dehydrogenase component
MSTESVKVTINGKDFQVPKGARLIDVCRDKGFDIPSFCYYSDLTLQASCRMCLVRIEKMPKLQTSCTIICTDGMIVTTQSEEIEKAQRGMTEFLLANHPLDCPVCDRGGECELQEMTFDWGGLEERFTEQKNYYAERYLSPMVANDPQRCILCKRCTRVCDEWMGEEAIEAGGRSVATVSRFARPERCSTRLIVTKHVRGNSRNRSPRATSVRTVARCRLAHAPAKYCVQWPAIVTSMALTASFSASRDGSDIRSSTTSRAFARR